MLMVRHDGEEVAMFVNGGFLEVMQDKVVVLADVAERAEDIDVAKAEDAKRHAEESLRQSASAVDLAAAEAALRRSLMQIKVAEYRRKKSGRA
jgi:F-type H+-transporting ATPase subunit epsilon